MRVFKPIAVALLYLGFGSAVSVAVAWGFALRGSVRLTHRYWMSWDESTWWLLPADVKEVLRLVDADARVSDSSTQTADGLGARVIVSEVNPPVGGYVEVVRFRFGWPCFCVQNTEKWDSGGNGGSLDGGLEYPRAIARQDSSDMFAGGPPLLPTHIEPWGFAADTALFGAAAFGLPRMWRASRGMFRRRTGRCAICGYDLSGSRAGVCPECGRASTAGDQVRSHPHPGQGEPC